MEGLGSYLPALFYATILITIFGICIKLFFLSRVRNYANNFPSLKSKFQIPNLLLYAFASSLLISALILSYLALFQTKANEAELSSSQKSVDILFIVDVSLSMNAGDVFPTRLKRAQDILLRLTPDLIGNRVGVLVFAGSAFSFCPMTSDLTAFSDYVNALGVDMIGKKGTDIALAFDKAKDLLASSKILKNRIVVFISDGEDHESSQLKSIDSNLQVWGIGSEEGGTIYFGEENSKTAGYVTKSGELTPNEKNEDVVISQLNETNLKNIAKINNGDYYNLSQESLGAYQLLSKIDEMKKNQTILLQKIRKEDGAAVYLVLAVSCFFLERFIRFFYFSKRNTTLFILFLLLMQTIDLKAWELDPGGNMIKEGVRLYEEKSYSESETKFKEAEEYFKEDPRLKFNQADIDFKKGNYAESIKKNNEVIQNPSTDNQLKAKALYNNGNAYFKLKDLKSAQKYYEETLSLTPEHEGAKKNLELLHKKPPQSNQNSSNNQSEQDNKQNQSPGQSNKKQNAPQSKDKQNEKENADRMMDHFSPDSILKNKSDSGGNRDNEKFW